MKKFKILMLVLMLNSAWAIAQKTVTGIVTSQSDGSSIPGVSIQIKGTTDGTITDLDGKYSIEVNENDILVFSYIGYEPTEKSVSGITQLDVSLIESDQALDEITVIGYGTVKKKDLTGAVTQVSSEDFEQRNVSSLSEALSGTMAGVQVSSFSGAPGSGAFISVRGLSTINDNSVLWVVDGMPVKSIDYLNTQDIESVHVLKDASSAAIYGAQGANGVIIVETKKGKKGKLKIDFNSRYGIQSVAKNPDLADATEYAKIQNMAALNDGTDAPYPNTSSIGKGTDWWNEVTQTAPIQDYYLGLTKGGDDYNVSTSVSYYNQDGVLKGGGYERITMRLNTDFKLGEKVRIGENFVFSNQLTNNGLDDYLVWDAMRIEPITPVFLPSYETSGLNEFSIYSPTLTDVGNVAAQLKRNFNTSKSLKTIGNIFLEVDPFEFLKLKSEFGVEIESWENNWFAPDYYIEPTDYREFNSVGATFGNKFLYNWNNIVTYKQSFGDHNLTVMGAVTLRSDSWNAVSGTGKVTPNNNEDFRYIQSTTQDYDASSENTKINYFSYLSRLNYDFKGKYLLTASIRRDGSSKFPESNSWATFPSVSAGWVLSEENFLNSVDWLDLLKIRGAWGQIGNDNISSEAQFTTIYNYYYFTGNPSNLQLGKAISQLGNNNLLWETVEDFNIGLDANFLNNKIVFGFDYFERKSSDMLMQKSLLSYMGLGYVRQAANIGSMSTKGLEFHITYKDKIGEVNYSIGLNASHSKSTMDKLADGEAIWEGNDQRLNELTYTAEGGTVGAFYGYVTDGIFQNQTEINSHSDQYGNIIQPTAQPGDFRFKDLNGDGQLTADGDRKVIGNPEALFTFGFNLGASYKGIDLRALFTGSYGNDLLTPIMAYTHSGNSNYNSYAGLLGDAWSGEGSTNSQPRVANVDANQNFRYSDYYVSDGSYLRVKNVQLGYTLPVKISQKAKIQKLRVFASVENLYTFTKYEGLDPDVGPYYSNALMRGVNWGNYPLPRIISFGLNLSF